MTNAYVNARIVTENGLVNDHALLTEGGRISAVVPCDAVPSTAHITDLGGGTLLAGFIDIQVNGGGGILFNDSYDAQALRCIGKAHAQFGTTGFLPTIISAELDTIAKAIACVDDAITAGVPGLLGIHIEGPFLNPSRKGIHNAANFRKLDEDSYALLTSLKHGKTLVTLAPEMTTPAMIARLTQAGVIVCAGHSEGDYITTREALIAGVRGFTHLFNAMSPLRSRAPGVVGAALEDGERWCGIIADGHHVHPAALRIAYACKGRDKLMLVTDAMPAVGTDLTHFSLQGRPITVEEGVCKGADGTLAGSDLDMNTAFNNAQTFLGVDETTASRLASANAADFLGLAQKTGRLTPGLSADFVLMEDKKVKQTWIGGVPQITNGR